jgi:hypothetical protein
MGSRCPQRLAWMRHRVRADVLIFLSVMFASGCQHSEPGSKPFFLFRIFSPSPAATKPQTGSPRSGVGSAAASPRPGPPFAESAAPFAATPASPDQRLEKKPIVFMVHFDIFRVRVPRGMFSESGKVWNHLSDQMIPAQTSTMLQVNGMRMGLGGTDAWAPIKGILDQEKLVETSSDNTTLGNGLPLVINLDQNRMRDQTFFLYRPDGKLAGMTCPMSRNMLRIEYALAIEKPKAVQVDIMPQIQQRETLGELTINQVGALNMPREEPTRVLRELAFRLIMNPDQFVVIGPSANAWQKKHLAGSLFFCEQVQGRECESAYFITPSLQGADEKPESPAR